MVDRCNNCEYFKRLHTIKQIRRFRKAIQRGLRRK